MAEDRPENTSHFESENESENMPDATCQTAGETKGQGLYCDEHGVSHGSWLSGSDVDRQNIAEVLSSMPYNHEFKDPKITTAIIALYRENIIQNSRFGLNINIKFGDFVDYLASFSKWGAMGRNEEGDIKRTAKFFSIEGGNVRVSQDWAVRATSSSIKTADVSEIVQEIPGAYGIKSFEQFAQFVKDNVSCDFVFADDDGEPVKVSDPISYVLKKIVARDFMHHESDITNESSMAFFPLALSSVYDNTPSLVSAFKRGVIKDSDIFEDSHTASTIKSTQLRLKDRYSDIERSWKLHSAIADSKDLSGMSRSHYMGSHSFAAKEYVLATSPANRHGLLFDKDIKVPSSRQVRHSDSDIFLSKMQNSDETQLSEYYGEKHSYVHKSDYVGGAVLGVLGMLRANFLHFGKLVFSRAYSTSDCFKSLAGLNPVVVRKSADPVTPVDSISHKNVILRNLRSLATVGLNALLAVFKGVFLLARVALAVAVIPVKLGSRSVLAIKDRFMSYSYSTHMDIKMLQGATNELSDLANRVQSDLTSLEVIGQLLKEPSKDVLKNLAPNPVSYVAVEQAEVERLKSKESELKTEKNRAEKTANPRALSGAKLDPELEQSSERFLKRELSAVNGGSRGTMQLDTKGRLALLEFELQQYGSSGYSEKYRNELPVLDDNPNLNLSAVSVDAAVQTDDLNADRLSSIHGMGRPTTETLSSGLGSIASNAGAGAEAGKPNLAEDLQKTRQASSTPGSTSHSA